MVRCPSNLFLFLLLADTINSRCLRVSKAWNNILTKSNVLRDLWHVQTYKLTQRSHPGIRRMLPAFKAYNKYGKNALRELSIDGLSHFLQWCKFSQVIEISQQLKVLKLREPRGSFELESLPPKLRLPKLTNLSLGYGVRPRPQVLEQLITACGSSLEELSIFELPHCDRLASDQVPWYPGWVKLEKLKVVRLAYPNYELRADPLPNLVGSFCCEDFLTILTICSVASWSWLLTWKKSGSTISRTRPSC